MACFWKALCECFQVFHFTKITNAIQYMVHCCITKQPEVDRISMWDKLLNDAAVIHVMLRAEGGSKIAFISCKRAGFLLSCSITVVNGAALLITVPVIAKYCSGKFSLTLETDLFTLTAMSFVERNSIYFRDSVHVSLFSITSYEQTTLLHRPMHVQMCDQRTGRILLTPAILL